MEHPGLERQCVAGVRAEHDAVCVGPTRVRALLLDRVVAGDGDGDAGAPLAAPSEVMPGVPASTWYAAARTAGVMGLKNNRFCTPLKSDSPSSTSVWRGRFAIGC
jgi:hypothetical protein